MKYKFNNSTLMTKYKDSYRGGELLRGIYKGKSGDHVEFALVTGGIGYMHLHDQVDFKIQKGELLTLRMHDPAGQLVVPRGLELERMGFKTVPCEGVVALTNSKLTSVYFTEWNKFGVHYHSGSMLMRGLRQGQKIVCDVVKEFIYRGEDLYVYGVSEIYYDDSHAKFDLFSQVLFDAAVREGSAEECQGVKPGAVCVAIKSRGYLVIENTTLKVVCKSDIGPVCEGERFAVQVSYINPDTDVLKATPLYKLDIL